MRRRAGSRAWNSLVTLKKTSEDSFFVNVSPWTRRYKSFVMTC